MNKVAYSAINERDKTITGYIDAHTNPILWEMIASGIGYYVNLLYDMGNRKKAKELLSEGMVEILNLHADDILRKNLSLKCPLLISKERFCKRNNSKF